MIFESQTMPNKLNQLVHQLLIRLPVFCDPIESCLKKVYRL